VAIIVGGMTGQQLRGMEIVGNEVKAAPSSTLASIPRGLTDALPKLASPGHRARG